jgi:hypothetical protein
MILGLLFALMAIAGLTLNQYFLLQRIETLEARPIFPKELAVKIITAQLVEDVLADLDLAEDEIDSGKPN